MHTDIDHVGETLPRGEELSPTLAVLREREQLAERAVRSHGGLRGALEATEEPYRNTYIERERERRLYK